MLPGYWHLVDYGLSEEEAMAQYPGAASRESRKQKQRKKKGKGKGSPPVIPRFQKKDDWGPNRRGGSGGGGCLIRPVGGRA